LKRIALVIPSLGPGGMERVMAELSKYFCLQPEIEVHLILYGNIRDIFYSLPNNITIHKPQFKFNNNLRIWNTIKTLIFLRNKINILKPNSILSFGEYWNNFVLLALYGMKYPVFISDRCQPDKSLGALHDRLRKLLYPKARGIITQTRQAEKFYKIDFTHLNIKTIGNPIRFIDTNELIQKEHIVLTVGRLINTKHHDQLIRVFDKINKPGWKLVIVGGDAIKQNNFVRLQALIEELDAKDRVLLTGSNCNVDQYYQKSRIFAFTSSSEGFPNVIGEAMSAGLPVVTFNCVAGPSDMITDGTDGFLVPLFDYECFKEKLQILMECDDLCIKMGLNAKKKINAYSIDNIGPQFYEFMLP